MARSPRTQVFVANGYYDLATPHFATEYTFNHMGLDAIGSQERPDGVLRGGAHDVCAQAIAGGASPAHLREFITDTG